MDELQCIVEAMLPLIEERFNSAPSTFKLWFGDFSLYSLDDSEAVFITPTELRKKILSKENSGKYECTCISITPNTVACKAICVFAKLAEKSPEGTQEG